MPESEGIFKGRTTLTLITILSQPVDIEQGLWPTVMSIPARDYQGVAIYFNFRDDNIDFGIRSSIMDALDVIEIGRACDDGVYIPTKR